MQNIEGLLCSDNRSCCPLRGFEEKRNGGSRGRRAKKRKEKVETSDGWSFPVRCLVRSDKGEKEGIKHESVLQGTLRTSTGMGKYGHSISTCCKLYIPNIHLSLMLISFPSPHGVYRLMVLGKGITFLICSSPTIQATVLSIPRP